MRPLPGKVSAIVEGGLKDAVPVDHLGSSHMADKFRITPIVSEVAGWSVRLWYILSLQVPQNPRTSTNGR